MTKSLNKGVLLPGFVGPQEKRKIPKQQIVTPTLLEKNHLELNFISNAPLYDQVPNSVSVYNDM
jgi:hypothetical protein